MVWSMNKGLNGLAWIAFKVKLKWNSGFILEGNGCLTVYALIESAQTREWM